MNKKNTTGRIGEKLVENKFKKLGFVFKNNSYKNCYHNCDFIVNGFNVEVKSTKSKVWSFNLQKNKGKFDILICVDIIKNIFLVIQYKDIKSQNGIKIKPFTKTKNWKYYSQFINQWKYLSTGNCILTP